MLSLGEGGCTLLDEGKVLVTCDIGVVYVADGTYNGSAFGMRSNNSSSCSDRRRRAMIPFAFYGPT